MAHFNYFLAKGGFTLQEMKPRWHFTRVWADGYKGKSLADAGVDKLEDIYFMHYAGMGNKIIGIKNDRHVFGYLGYDRPDDVKSNVNVGMVVLSTTQLQNTIMNNRLDIEDNIGEGIHVHYKNLRLDFTIEDYLELAKACDESLRKYIELRNS